MEWLFTLLLNFGDMHSLKLISVFLLVFSSMHQIHLMMKEGSPDPILAFIQAACATVLFL